MEDLMKNLEAGEVTIPDLDWLKLKVEDKDNYPTELPIEVIPQLQEAWNHERRSTTLISNVLAPTKNASQLSSSSTKDIVNTAKKEIMLGSTGKLLTEKLSSLYPMGMIQSAKDELVKVAAEQGLLGNVYVDLSAFETCRDAARVLGSNRIRTAKFVVGSPTRSVCSSHKAGFCKELKRNVVDQVMYDQALFDEYTQHLKMAGALPSEGKITSKEELRGLFLKRADKAVDFGRQEVRESSVSPISSDKLQEAFEKELEKNAQSARDLQAKDRFFKARPILAFIQNEMLNGINGTALKDAIAKNIPENVIKQFSPEIKKLASLQGLMGNVYADVSYYRNADEAIKMIRAATTKPSYLIQSLRDGEFDGTLAKVAKATGCSELPRDGKIDKEIARSYIDDLHFSGKIANSAASDFRKMIDASDNTLKVIKEAFESAQSYKKPVRQGGVMATLSEGIRPKQANRDNIKSAVYESLNKGIGVDVLQNKVASYIPVAESMGLVRDVLSNMKEVCASALPACTKDKYLLSADASLKQAQKCTGCIYNMQYACSKQGIRFASSVKDPDKATIELDAKTKKVQLKENPDLSRGDMDQPYDMETAGGSGMNIALDEMRKSKTAQDVDLGVSAEGIDLSLESK